MKKIGIITFHNAQNFGAVMQSFALQKFLSKDYETYLINYSNKNILKNYKLIKIRKKKPITSIISSICNLKKNISRKKYYKDFMDKYFNLTEKYNDIDELKKNYPKFDVYITGSDQVWNSHITKGLEDSYTLNFGDNKIKKISYAASVGDERLIDINKDEYRNKLNHLNAISIREETTKELLQKYINQNIDVVLDPTLLLDKQIYEDIIKEKTNVKENYIFIGDVVPNSEYLKIAEYLSEKTKMKKVYTSEKEKINNELINCYNKGPLEFLSYLVNSKYIVTNSYHVIIFSIIFQKDFWVCPPENNSSRIVNLLKKLGIENRIINSLSEFKNIDYNQKIDYNKVKNKLETERKKSIDWLLQTIEKEK